MITWLVSLFAYNTIISQNKPATNQLKTTDTETTFHNPIISRLINVLSYSFILFTPKYLILGSQTSRCLYHGTVFSIYYGTEYNLFHAQCYLHGNL